MLIVDDINESLAKIVEIASKKANHPSEINLPSAEIEDDQESIYWSDMQLDDDEASSEEMDLTNEIY